MKSEETRSAFSRELSAICLVLRKESVSELFAPEIQVIMRCCLLFFFLKNTNHFLKVTAFVLARRDLLALLATDAEESDRLRRFVDSEGGSGEGLRLAERRMRSFFASMRAHGEAEVLTDQTREDMVVTMAHQLKRLPLFSGASLNFVKDLVGRLKPAVYEERNKIFEEGAAGEEMYFISSGSVSIVKGENTKKNYDE